MFKLTWRLPVGAAALLALFVLGAVALGSTAAAETSPVISANDLAVFRIHNAVDVTAQPDSAMPDTGVSRAAAITTAQQEVGPGLKEVGVMHAKAAQFVDGAERSVWVVIFSGGVMPFDGPYNAAADAPGVGTTRPATVTGVVIDDTTGEFLRGFMH